MPYGPPTLAQLRDLHFGLALRFEQYARTESDAWYYKDKTEEALSGAIHFENLMFP